jgi:DnaJ-class molecular chaperone
MNFYAILGIPRDAAGDTIRSAYRILARRYHPDRGAGSSTEKFRQLNEAYETLIDRGTRAAYDRSLQRTERPVIIPRESMVTRSRPFVQEDPAVFGRLERHPYEATFERFVSSGDCFDQMFDLFDDLFFGSE